MVDDGCVMVDGGCVMVSYGGAIIGDGGVIGDCVSTNICDLRFSRNCNILAVVKHHKKEVAR